MRQVYTEIKWQTRNSLILHETYGTTCNNFYQIKSLKAKIATPKAFPCQHSTLTNYTPEDLGGSLYTGNELKLVDTRQQRREDKHKNGKER